MMLLQYNYCHHPLIDTRHGNSSTDITLHVCTSVADQLIILTRSACATSNNRGTL